MSQIVVAVGMKRVDLDGLSKCGDGLPGAPPPAQVGPEVVVGLVQAGIAGNGRPIVVPDLGGVPESDVQRDQVGVSDGMSGFYLQHFFEGGGRLPEFPLLSQYEALPKEVSGAGLQGPDRVQQRVFQRRLLRRMALELGEDGARASSRLPRLRCACPKA